MEKQKYGKRKKPRGKQKPEIIIQLVVGQGEQGKVRIKTEDPHLNDINMALTEIDSIKEYLNVLRSQYVIDVIIDESEDESEDD